MNAGVLPAFRISIWPLPGWLVAALIVGTAALGGPLGGLAKPLFVFGCAALQAAASASCRSSAWRRSGR